MQITIVGAGKTGFAVASQLNREGHEVSIIERNEVVLNEAVAALDITGQAGNGVSRSVLEEAVFPQEEAPCCRKGERTCLRSRMYLRPLTKVR